MPVKLTMKNQPEKPAYKSQIQIYKKEGDMNVMEKWKGIPPMEHNTVLTIQYTFPNRVFQPRQNAKVTVPFLVFF